MLCNVYETGPQQSLEVNEKKIKGKKKTACHVNKKLESANPFALETLS